MVTTAADLKAKLILELEDEMSKAANKAVNNVIKDSEKTEKSWENTFRNINKAAEKSFQRIQKGQALIRKGAVTMLKGGALSAPFIAAAKHAADYEKGLAEVATLTNKSVAEIISDFGPIVDATQKSFGQKQQETIKALYDGISAGVPATKEAVNEYLKVTSKLAVGGVTDEATAGDVLTTTVNSFGKEITTFKDAADVLFTTVKGGKTTVGEIAQSFGQTAKVAAEAGATLPELGAAVAAITAAGVKTPEAITQTKGLFAALISPVGSVEKKMKSLGLTINAATIRNEGVAKTFQKMDAAIKRQNKGLAGQKKAYRELFPNIRAYQAVLALSGPKFTAELAEQEKRLGAHDRAFDKMSKTSAFRYSKLIQELSVTWKDVGMSTIPLLEELGKELIPIVKGTAAWVAENKDVVKGIAKGVFYVSAAVLAFGALQYAAGAAMIAMSPLGVTALALGSIAYLVWDVSHGFSEWGKDVKTMITSLDGLLLTVKKVAGFWQYIISGGETTGIWSASEQAKLEGLQRRESIRTEENTSSIPSIISNFGKASLPNVTNNTGGDTMTNNFYGSNSDLEKNMMNMLNQHEARKQKKIKRMNLASTGG